MPQSVRISSGKKSRNIGAKRNTLDIMAAHDLEVEMAKKPKKDKWDLPELAIYKMDNILRLQKNKLLENVEKPKAITDTEAGAISTALVLIPDKMETPKPVIPKISAMVHFGLGPRDPIPGLRENRSPAPLRDSSKPPLIGKPKLMPTGDDQALVLNHKNIRRMRENEAALMNLELSSDLKVASYDLLLQRTD
jgi:hypothetical protein